MSKHFHDAELLDDPSPEELEGLDQQLLSSMLKLKTKSYYITPRERHLSLLDLRVIFSSLRRRTHCPSSEPGEEETLPFDAFQRAFERLFFVLQEPEIFDGRDYDENADGFVAWSEFFRVYKKKKITITCSLQERVFLTFNNPDSSHVAQYFSIFVLAAIMLSSGVFMIGTLPVCKVRGCEMAGLIEKVCLLIFTFEYIVKFCTCWAVRSEVHDWETLHDIVVGHDPIVLPSKFIRWFRFVRAPGNILDLAAILPGLVGLFVDQDNGAFVIFRIIRLTRIFKALKSPGMVAPVVAIRRTVQQSTQALYVLAFNLCLGLTIFGSLMYMAEGGSDLRQFGLGGRWNEAEQVYERTVSHIWNKEDDDFEPIWERSPFQSIPHAFWWAIVTATTVGYGDDYPTTTAGILVTLVTTLFSMVILALPVGVMGNIFSSEWENYEKELEEKAAVFSQEMAFITAATKKLDPGRMATMMLIELWHEHPIFRARERKTRPAGPTFLGDVKLELDLPPDRSVTKPFRIGLGENEALVHRLVSGFLCGEYEWTPLKGGDQANHLCEDLNFRGTLRVTIKSADGLINVNCGGGVSSPYCTVLAYPGYDATNGPMPRLWRTATHDNTLNPQWDAMISMDFSWHVSHAAQQELAQQQMTAWEGEAQQRRLRAGATGSPRPSLPSCSPGPLEEAMGLLRSCTADLRQQKQEMSKVREDVQTLKAFINMSSDDEVRLPNSMPDEVTQVRLPNSMPDEVASDELTQSVE